MHRALILGVVTFLAGCTGRFEPAGPVQHESQSVELDKSEMVDVQMNLAGGELRVSGGSPKLMEANFDYSNAENKPVVRYDPSSFRGRLTIEQPHGFVNRANATYKWNLKLNDGVPLDVTAHLGAGEAHMNLGSLTLRRIEVQIGAGELHMDLRGSPKRDYDVRIRGGVGEAEVHLPGNVGIDARASGGLGDISVQGLEKSGGRWINPSQEHAPATIHLDISGGVGDIKLIAD